MSVRPSRVRSSQPPGSVTTKVEESTERRISESGEVKGVCPESAPLAPRNMILEKEPILSNRAQAKRKMRYRRIDEHGPSPRGLRQHRAAQRRWSNQAGEGVLGSASDRVRRIDVKEERRMNSSPGIGAGIATKRLIPVE